MERADVEHAGEDGMGSGLEKSKQEANSKQTLLRTIGVGFWYWLCTTHPYTVITWFANCILFGTETLEKPFSGLVFGFWLPFALCWTPLYFTRTWHVLCSDSWSRQRRGRAIQLKQPSALLAGQARWSMSFGI